MTKQRKYVACYEVVPKLDFIRITLHGIEVQAGFIMSYYV